MATGRLTKFLNGPLGRAITLLCVGLFLYVFVTIMTTDTLGTKQKIIFFIGFIGIIAFVYIRTMDSLTEKQLKLEEQLKESLESLIGLSSEGFLYLQKYSGMSRYYFVAEFKDRRTHYYLVKAGWGSHEVIAVEESCLVTNNTEGAITGVIEEITVNDFSGKILRPVDTKGIKGLKKQPHTFTESEQDDFIFGVSDYSGDTEIVRYIVPFFFVFEGVKVYCRNLLATQFDISVTDTIKFIEANNLIQKKRTMGAVENTPELITKMFAESGTSGDTEDLVNLVKELEHSSKESKEMEGAAM